MKIELMEKKGTYWLPAGYSTKQLFRVRMGSFAFEIYKKVKKKEE